MSVLPSNDGPLPLSSLPRALRIVFARGGPADAERAMQDWLDHLAAEAAGKIAILSGDPASQPFLPAFSAQAEHGPTLVHYHFVPRGREEEPFREWLWHLAEAKPPASSEKDRQGATRQRPAEVLLFVSAQCPNCPSAVRMVSALALETGLMTVHILDAFERPEISEHYRIRSVPTLLIDRNLPVVGVPDRKQLLALLQKDKPAKVLQDQVLSLIQSGHVSEAAGILAAGLDPSFLAQRFQNPTFHEKLALLTTLEEALEISPSCLDPLADRLVPLLNSEQAPLRGDIADLLGKIGHSCALPALEALCQDPDPDVAEAAQEACRMIHTKARVVEA
jgi:hypothetical protein